VDAESSEEEEEKSKGKKSKSKDISKRRKTGAEGEDGEEMVSKSKKAKKAMKGRKKQEDFGSARGLDFQDVGTVVNVDFPPSVKTYSLFLTHHHTLEQHQTAPNSTKDSIG
jgi:ATP-dependent RNA helicase DDX56/DBP9